MSQVVTDFINAYVREFDYYQSAAAICARRCEKLLATQGVRAIVSHRAKKPSKLASKVQQRNKDKNYATPEAIRADIPDLAGVRIALYFPADREKVNAILTDNFDVVLTKNFPEKAKPKKGTKRFDGYHADHYRVVMPETALEDVEKTYAAASIEIQVGSVLMHAWAEVEHDLVYKPESGMPSEEEHAILDELNGLVIAGEIALERLQKAGERRLSASDGAQFDNHYELAAFLHKWVRGKLLEGTELPIGRVDVLWELLKRADLNSPDKIKPFLPEVLDVDGAPNPLSDQITDRILSTDQELYATYVALQSNLTVPEAYVQSTPQAAARAGSTSDFLASWITLERTFRNLDPASSEKSHVNPLKRAELLNLSPEGRDAIAWVRRLRNNLVHGIEIPSRKVLTEATSALDMVFTELAVHPDQTVRDALAQARASRSQ